MKELDEYMKVCELSIGDWVKVLNYHWNGRPYIGQVDGIMKKHGTYYLQFGYALSAEIDVCEPIPLTPEILEKNGFGYKEEDSYYIHFYQGERCYIANSDLHIVTNKKGVFWLNYYNNSIHWLRYVHELQHAFRLCHVEKQIEL